MVRSLRDGLGLSEVVLDSSRRTIIVGVGRVRLQGRDQQVIP